MALNAQQDKRIVNKQQNAITHLPQALVHVSMTVAYGINRVDWSYYSPGVASGTGAHETRSPGATRLSFFVTAG